MSRLETTSEDYCSVCGKPENNMYIHDGELDIPPHCKNCFDRRSSRLSKRNGRPATEAQMRYIRQIEELLNISFYGNTVDDASYFIDVYRDRYQAKLHTPYKYR